MNRNKRTKGRGTVRLEEVAIEAGVARSTVSRALSKPGRVSDKTRNVILKAARRLGYTPNVAARSLKKGHGQLVLLLLPPWSNSIIWNTMRGVEEELVRRGYGLIVGHQSQASGTERHLLELAGSGLADGIIVLSGDVSALTSGKKSRVSQNGIPVVGLLQDFTNSHVNSIVTNDMEAMFVATRHLLDLGHRRFFYVGGPAGNYHEIERCRGVRDCLTTAGIDDRDLLIYRGDFQLGSGVAAGRAFLLLPNPPTAVISCSDYMALGFIKTVQAAGRCVPEDVAVVGFDGIDYGEYITPSLTTVVQPMEEMGKAAVCVLFDLLGKPTKARATRIVIDSRLVIRGSTLKSA